MHLRDLKHRGSLRYLPHDSEKLETVLKAEAKLCLLSISGTNKHPDRTLTVVAIVIPIILSICVILSCYCFRKYVLENEKLAYVGLRPI